jgi:hypothetical protein
MQQLAYQICGLPVQAVFLSNGQLAFSRLGDFHAIIDTSESGDVSAILTNENIKIADEELNYNTAYNVSVKIREWLIKQNMIYPL